VIGGTATVACAVLGGALGGIAGGDLGEVIGVSISEGSGMSIEPALIWMSILGPGSVAVLALIYVAHRHLDEIEALLANSRYIGDLKATFSGAGLIGKVLRTCVIGGVLLAPGPYARRGLIDLSEVKRFPVGMKRVIVGLLLMLVVCFLLMLAFRAWTYLGSG